LKSRKSFFETSDDGEIQMRQIRIEIFRYLFQIFETLAFGKVEFPYRPDFADNRGAMTTDD
jgi:hypothetical protein